MTDRAKTQVEQRARELLLAELNPANAEQVRRGIRKIEDSTIDGAAVLRAITAALTLSADAVRMREALGSAIRDLDNTYTAAKSGRPIEISIGQFGRLEAYRTAHSGRPVMSEKLEPCPGCEGTDLEVGWVETGFDKRHHVLCNGCQHETHGYTRWEAIAAWNAPPVPSAPTDDALREAVARKVAKYQISMGLSEEDAWEDGWGITDAILSTVKQSTGDQAVEAAPLDMVLQCPKCGLQHIDEPEFVLAWTGGAVPEPSHEEVTWTNPPHRSHLCHGCGCIWRPADVATNGVAAVQTRGSADTWEAALSQAHRPMDGVREAVIDAAKVAHDAINEMFRYFDGGETRGSYDGKPERDQLRKSGYKLDAALRALKSAGDGR